MRNDGFVQILLPNKRLFLGDTRKLGLKNRIRADNNYDYLNGLTDADSCIVEFGSHKEAVKAKIRIENGDIKQWNRIFVEWAEPTEIAEHQQARFEERCVFF